MLAIIIIIIIIISIRVLSHLDDTFRQILLYELSFHKYRESVEQWKY